MRKKFKEIHFKFTPPGTPHQNDVIEGGFTTYLFHMYVMMAHAGLHKNLKTGLWTKCAATATKLENMLVNPKKNTHTVNSMEKCQNTQKT